MPSHVLLQRSSFGEVQMTHFAHERSVACMTLQNNLCWHLIQGNAEEQDRGSHTHLQMPTNFLFTSEPLLAMAFTPLPKTIIVGLSRANVRDSEVSRQRIAGRKCLGTGMPATGVCACACVGGRI